MKYLRNFIYLILFLAVGEIIVRIDKYLHPFANEDTVKTAIKIGESEELKMLQKKSLPVGDSDIRVMVLGDSYIYGAGIDRDKAFSNQLRLLLKHSNKKYGNVYVLDVARPSNNTLDNYNAYFQFVTQFKPTVVILGYNINDIYGDLEPNENNASSGLTASLPTKAGHNPLLINKIFKIIYTSELARLTLSNFNKELKTLGYVIPSSEFGQELKSYYMNEPNWRKSKKLLSGMINDAAHRKIKLIALCMPEMDLLNSPRLFSAADTSIQNFFTGQPYTTFINGRVLFKGKKSKEYRLSKYDGHPNEKAHLLMANYVYSLLIK